MRFALVLLMLFANASISYGWNKPGHEIVAAIAYDRHAPVFQYAPSYAIRIAAPTMDTRELARFATWCLSKIWRPEHQYKKAGVLMFDLCKYARAQHGLFSTGDREKTARLMAAMDNINSKHGRGIVRLAAASPVSLSACRTWHLRADHKSPRYTTRWEDLASCGALSVPTRRAFEHAAKSEHEQSNQYQ